MGIASAWTSVEAEYGPHLVDVGMGGSRLHRAVVHAETIGGKTKESTLGSLKA